MNDEERTQDEQDAEGHGLSARGREEEQTDEQDTEAHRIKFNRDDEQNDHDGGDDGKGDSKRWGGI